MKKLLILGNNAKTDVLIRRAKERGYYTVLSDNLPSEKSVLKKIVDEAWDISVTDTEELVRKAQETGITGVTCGASETCMLAVKEVCKKMNLPFYVSDYAWEIVNDKKRFKDLCIECNIPVAKEYILDIDFKKKDLDNIVYPVMVKPVDCCSSIGLHFCENEEELIAGYKDAYEKSTIKKVLVEKFYSGVETHLEYIFKNAKPILIETGDSFGYKKASLPVIFGCGPTIFNDKYKEELLTNLECLFKKLGCKEGTATVQIVQDAEGFAVIEMNYRIPGANSPMQDCICDAVLDAVMSDDYLDINNLPKVTPASAYMFWVRPGKISSIEGVDKIKNIPGVNFVWFSGKVGDEIAPMSGLRQMVGGAFMSELNENFRKGVSEINNTLKIKDDKGEDMLMKFMLDENYKVNLIE